MFFISKSEELIEHRGAVHFFLGILIHKFRLLKTLNMAHLFDEVRKFFQTMFPASSSEAYNIDDLFLNFLILAAVIMLIVILMVVLGGYFFRSKAHPEPRQITGNKKLELAWTILPFIAVSFFFILTVRSMKQINQPFTDKQDPDIEIIAHQWWWDMRYPRQKVITANELHIPVGKRLLMRIESADVIHSWWVPALGRKTDAIPGHINYSWIEADTAGVFHGACSEYCGTEHAWMLIRVVAEPEEKYQAWLKAQQATPPVPEEGPGRQGALLFQRKTCGNCHAIKGTPADAHIGPDLSHVASRATLLSGMMINNAENLRKWLSDPQKVKMGAHMPDFNLSDKEITDLQTYLEGLK